MLVEINKINKEEVVTCTSLDVSRTFTYFDEEENKNYVREHKAVMRSVREIKCSDEFRGENYSLSTFIDSRGKEQPMYQMTKDGLVMLVMGFTDPKAQKFKEAYIRQFNAMEKALFGKIKEREKGIVVRQALTIALKESQENERMHGFAYSTYTNAIYKVLFNRTAAQLREERGILTKDNLRDYFTAEELKAVQSMEMLVSGLVDCGWGYSEIKDFISEKTTMKIT